MIEELSLAISSDHKMQNVGGKLPKCGRCDSDASPLFFGFETIRLPDDEHPGGLVRPILWCRGCINLNPELENRRCG